MTRIVPLFAILLLAGGCEAFLPRKVPDEPPPLRDMKEPLDLIEEPDDEAARREMPSGSFTGLVVAPAWESLDDPEPAGLLVNRVVENSPGDAAGILPEDILIAAVDPEGEEHELRWPSQWREFELRTAPGAEVTVIFDRAGREGEAVIRLIPRIRPADRQAAERFRETERIGVVLRTATEVEAREAGLAPGGGAVIVGLSSLSPWRRAGLIYRDLIVAIEGRSVDHPQVVLNAIREGEDHLEVEFIREGARRSLATAVSSRRAAITHLGVPPLFDYESDRGETELSILLGLLRHRSTEAAWDWRFLWLFHLSGGDTDRLVEVDDR